MISDKLTQLSLYSSVHPHIIDVQNFINNTNLTLLENGKHPINKNGAFASVNEYEPKLMKDTFVECHKKYIDVQILVHGGELIGFGHVDNCTAEPYDEDKDLQKLSGAMNLMSLEPGYFVVFFPHDAHQPGIKSNVPLKKVKKIVFKLPVQ